MKNLYEGLSNNQKRFLACFEHTASVARAARFAKLSRQAHYLWMDQDPKYREIFQKVEERSVRLLEDEAVRRAHEGVKKAVYYQGKVVGQEIEYSDALLALLLKANHPNKYRDRWSGEITGKDGAPLVPLTMIDSIIRGDSETAG